MKELSDDVEHSMRKEILALAHHRGKGKTFCPTEVARALANGWGWRSYMPYIRDIAVDMATKGLISIYKTGNVADPQNFKGIYRIGLPTNTIKEESHKKDISSDQKQELETA
jgi:hypothetical protein